MLGAGPVARGPPRRMASPAGSALAAGGGASLPRHPLPGRSPAEGRAWAAAATAGGGPASASGSRGVSGRAAAERSGAGRAGPGAVREGAVEAAPGGARGRADGRGRCPGAASWEGGSGRGWGPGALGPRWALLRAARLREVLPGGALGRSGRFLGPGELGSSLAVWERRGGCGFIGAGSTRACPVPVLHAGAGVCEAAQPGPRRWPSRWGCDPAGLQPRCVPPRPCSDLTVHAFPWDFGAFLEKSSAKHLRCFTRSSSCCLQHYIYPCLLARRFLPAP